MAYAFVQQNASDDANSAATITVTLTPTAGNLLVFALGGEFLDTTSITLSDDLGVHNTFSQIDTDLVLDQRCAWWYAANCKGGATTFTATFSGPTRFRLIYVAEYSGIATTTPFLNGTRAASVIPGTGTDAISSGTANATSQPALVWGFSIDVEGSATPSAGTGFTSRTGVWSSATSFGRPEDKRVTATGNVAATFTAATGTDTYGTVIGIFLEATATPTSTSWSPDFPDQIRSRTFVSTIGVSASPVLTPTLTPLSWRPSFPDHIPARPVPNFAAGSAVAPVFVPAAATPLSWSPRFPDTIPHPRPPLITGGSVAPALSIPNTTSSIFPLTISSNGRHFRKNDGTPFLVCADTTWSIFVDIPLASVGSYFSTLVSQGFNALMGNAIEHHYSIVKPPKERGGLLPFTQRLDGATYTGSPNGATNTTGTQGQFGSDAYSSPSNQAPDCTFINNSYWLIIEQILDSALANNLLIFIWPGYLGFQAGDQGWMLEMTLWDSAIGAGGFTGQSFADPTKSKLWNYGAWLADRWKNYPNIVWTMGGDYGTNTNTLTTTERAAVVSLAAGLKSVTGQQSTLWTSHWDRPCISDDNLITGVTWDINFCYSDEAVAELCRRGYNTASKPSLLGEYNYEDGLFGGNAPWRKYTWWGFLGGIAGGFYGHEQLWRFDDGTPGTDWQTLLATQARLDVIRQFAFLKSKPWHRLIPNGLSGIGTLITAGGGTASPQSTDYVATAATPEKDLLLAYAPPAHTGAVTVDMTKLGASVTARWFDPANGTFTSIGTFANTGTHAFTTPGNNSAGDADWLLVLDAPDAAMPLSWTPKFPDRAQRPSLTLAQVVSGIVEPTAPPPPITIADWSPNVPDNTGRIDRLIRRGGLYAPVATLPDPVPLSWLSVYPDRSPGWPRVTLSSEIEPPRDTNAEPLDWSPAFPDRTPGRVRVTPSTDLVLVSVVTPVPLPSWTPDFPDVTQRPHPAPEGGAIAPLVPIPTPSISAWECTFPNVLLHLRGSAAPGGATSEELPRPNTAFPALSWSPHYPDTIARQRGILVIGGSFAPEVVISNPPAPALSWTPSYPDSILRVRSAFIISSAFAPEMQPVPTAPWIPSFPDTASRARTTQIVGGNAGPEAVQPNIPPAPSWATVYPDAVRRANNTLIIGGLTTPEATLPNPPAPSRSWAPAFPAFVPRAPQPVNVGGMTGPEATIPNPPAPPLSWTPEFPDFALPYSSQLIGIGGMTGPVAPGLVTPKTMPPGRASEQLIGHVATRFVESRHDEDAHLYGTVRKKRDV